jgi:hypothetical protein
MQKDIEAHLQGILNNGKIGVNSRNHELGSATEIDPKLLFAIFHSPPLCF